MSHGARRDQSVTPGRFDIARAGKPDHCGEAGDVDAGLDALGTSKGEIDHVATAGRDHAARSLARDRGFEGDFIEEQGLDELRFGKRCGHLEDGLAGERDSAFRNRPDVAGKAKAAKRLEVAHLVALRLFQVAEVVLFEAKVPQPIEA